MYQQSYDYGYGYGQYPQNDYYSDYRYQDRGYPNGSYGQYPSYYDYGANGYQAYDQPAYGGYPDDLEEAYPDYSALQGGYGYSSTPSAMAIAGLVIGLVSVLFCCFNGINNFAFISAVVGFFLSMVGIFATLSRKRSGRSMAISALILNSAAIAGVIISQAVFGTNLIEQFQTLGSGTTSSSPSGIAFISKSGNSVVSDALANHSSTQAAPTTDDESEGDGSDDPSAGSDDAIQIEGFSVEAKTYSFRTDINDRKAILVEIAWTNDSEEERTARQMVSVEAYQDGEALDLTYIKGVDSFASRNKGVGPNETSTFYAAFALINSSDVTLKVSGLDDTRSSVTFEAICKIQ